MKNKRGQITIFVILGVLVVVSIGLLFVLYDRSGLDVEPSNPEEADRFISQCVSQAVDESVDIIIDNGGYIGEEFLGMEFEYELIPYWCYTSRVNTRCTPLEPITVEHFEKEIEKSIEVKIGDCFENLREELDSRGYDVDLGVLNGFSVNLVEGNIEIFIDRRVDFEKSDEPRRFDNFDVSVRSPLYKLVIASQEIVRQEVTYCNSDYVLIERGGSNLNIDKFQTGDDRKIYTVEDLISEKGWKFAIRNCVLSTPS